MLNRELVSCNTVRTSNLHSASSQRNNYIKHPNCDKTIKRGHSSQAARAKEKQHWLSHPPKEALCRCHHRPSAVPLKETIAIKLLSINDIFLLV